MKPMPRRVVITGANGLLGRSAMSVLAMDHQVRGVDLAPVENLVDACDIRDTERLEVLFRDADSVLHLAGQDSADDISETRFFDLNTFGTWSVCEAASRAGVKRLVYCSSASVYGLDHTNPGLAPQALPVTEDHPTFPSQPYALSKRAAEEAVSALSRSRPKMVVSTLRLSAVICDSDIASLRRDLGETPMTWKKPFKASDSMPEGRNDYWVPLYRSYITTLDAATAFAAALAMDRPGYHLFNICADDTLTPEPTLAFVTRTLGSLPPVEDAQRYRDNPRSAVFSNAKAARDLGWAPIRTWRQMTMKASWPLAEDREKHHG
ncbi:MAG: NAD(P)-dependent oxidoreductase [Albidovulum sp.]|uniref:NAD-dependent epimerase/dehydratase family protein n=1 Tax=Albidovulum sp. TaxID=1872424 RepID=UPI003C920887